MGSSLAIPVFFDSEMLSAQKLLVVQHLFLMAITEDDSLEEYLRYFVGSSNTAFLSSIFESQREFKQLSIQLSVKELQLVKSETNPQQFDMLTKIQTHEPHEGFFKRLTTQKNIIGFGSDVIYHFLPELHEWVNTEITKKHFLLSVVFTPGFVNHRASLLFTKTGSKTKKKDILVVYLDSDNEADYSKVAGIEYKTVENYLYALIHNVSDFERFEFVENKPRRSLAMEKNSCVLWAFILPILLVCNPKYMYKPWKIYEQLSDPIRTLTMAYLLVIKYYVRQVGDVNTVASKIFKQFITTPMDYERQTTALRVPNPDLFCSRCTKEECDNGYDNKYCRFETETNKCILKVRDSLEPYRKGDKIKGIRSVINGVLREIEPLFPDQILQVKRKRNAFHQDIVFKQDTKKRKMGKFIDEL